MTRRLRTGLLATVLCLGLAGTGCVRIPDSGVVRRGAPASNQQEPALIEVRPYGPLAGDSAQQVVEGFLDAMQAYPPSSTVARRFLTPAADAGWHPEASTLVYSDHQSGTAGGGAVRVQATLIGKLSAQHSWESAPSGGRILRRDLRLVRVRGDWRIANPMAGTMVSQSYFERYYRPYAIYFLDRSREVVVPDLRYLPEGTQTPTLLVQDLIGGPTPTLAPAVDTLLPASTEVNVSVPVNAAGVANVALSRDVLSLGAEERQLLLAQVLWTLRQASTITAVRVTAGGVPLDIPGSAETSAIDALPAFDPTGFTASRQLFGLERDRLVGLSGGDTTAVDGPLGRGQVPVDSFAVDLPARRAAVVSANRRKLLVAGISAAESQAPLEMAVWYAGGTRLLRPSWDRTGRLWVVDQTRAGARVMVLNRGNPTTLRIRGLTGTDVSALRVSRDGVRLAAVVSTGRRARLLVGEILRTAEGAVRSVTPLRPVVSPLVRLRGVVDLSWSSPTSLAVLAGVHGEVLQPYVVAVDGSSVSQSSALPAVGVTAVAAANADVPVVVGTSAGRLWIRRADLQWTLLAGNSRIRSPTYAG